jgi:hypothetical protein
VEKLVGAYAPAGGLTGDATTGRVAGS